jgi:GxxExxY protein
MDEKLLYKELTDQIIGLYFKVYNNLGYGFLEKVYENALVLELQSAGMRVSTQQPISVYYIKSVVGNYYADLIIDDKVIVELKACDELCVDHRYQLVNYLKATSIEVGLLPNFGKKPEFRRVVFSNYRKILIPSDQNKSTGSLLESTLNPDSYPSRSAESASSAFYSSPEVPHG